MLEGNRVEAKDKKSRNIDYDHFFINDFAVYARCF